jgi:uncharacterized membrane protein YkvA (DUF1232 family)
MPSKFHVPDVLDRYLLTSSAEKTLSIATYIERGSPLITPDAVRALHTILPELRSKTARIQDSILIKRRIEVLLVYFEETFGAHLDAAGRDISFALFYFLKGYDRIPDSIPEIGLLDDALIVNTVLEWHQTALRTHWLRHGRTWPEDV